MKQSLALICCLLWLVACRPATDKAANKVVSLDSRLFSNLQAGDSALFVKELDTLPAITFPFLSTFYNRSFSTVLDISKLKDHQLFKLPFKRLPRSTETGSIDDDEKDTLFDLCDEQYKAKWNLIAKTPKYVVLEVYTGYAFLVTLTYQLKLINAIRTGYADPAGNVHWHAYRAALIKKDLTIQLQHFSEVQVDEQYNYETHTDSEDWYIDSNGFIKQK